MSMSASEALAGAAIAALGAIADLSGVHDGPPLQGAPPYAQIGTGPESDWSHKSGEGRELILTVLIHDAGEPPDRPRRLAAEAEAAIGAIEADLGEWRLVTLIFVRSKMLPDGRGKWVAAIDYRARMLRA